MKLASLFNSTIWAIRAEEFELLNQYVSLQIRGIQNPEVEAQIQALKRGRPAKISGGVAVLPVRGVISHRSSFFSELFGGASVERMSEDLDMMVKNPNIGAIVLDVDSPGGSVSGVMEFAEQIQEARKEKKIVAVANPQSASAAYHIASAAEELIVAPSGSVGSIGVFMMHQDFSEAMKAEGINTTFIKAGKYKTEGNPYEPLTDEAKEALQERVDAYYDYFVKGVAKGRGVNASDVRNGFGQGRMVMAKDAVKQGMADRVGTLADTLQRLGVKAESERKFLSGEAETPDIEATSDDKALEAERRQREIDMF
jgi:signal peptide peptidase SppA